MSLIVFLILAASVLLVAQSLFSIYLMLYTWEHPERLEASRGPTTYLPPSLSFSVLLPARNEEAVIYETIKRAWDADYPSDLLEVVVICHADDYGTIAEADRAVREIGSPRVRVETFSDGPINKPHGLNVGLERTENEVVTIFDAEDDIDTEIFNIINTVMLEREASVVQAGVQLMNFRDRWFSAHNCLEYFFYFKSRLHYHAKVGMIPLGGNTVFMRRSLIETVGGWDEHCLTEDADIGLRISALGEPTHVVYDAQHVTREETPDSVGQFIRQRTRWAQGFLQVLEKRSWLSLNTLGQKLLAAYTFAFPIVQALLSLLWPPAVVALIWLEAPVLVAIFTCLPLYALLLQLALSVVGVYVFAHEYHLKVPLWVPLSVTVTFLPYQWLLGISAVRAFYRQLRNQTSWEKTSHAGAHRRPEIAFPAAYEQLLGQAFGSLDAERGSVMVLDRARGGFSIKASRGLPDGVAESAQTEAGGGVAEWVASRGIPVVINGGHELPGDLRSRLKQPDLVSSVVLPVERNGEVAVVSLSSKVSSFGHEDLLKVGTSVGAARIAPEKPIVGIPEPRKHGTRPTRPQRVRRPRHLPWHAWRNGERRRRAASRPRHEQRAPASRAGSTLPSLSSFFGPPGGIALPKRVLPRSPQGRSLVLSVCLLVCGAFATGAALAFTAEMDGATDPEGAQIAAAGGPAERGGNPTGDGSTGGKTPDGPASNAGPASDATAQGRASSTGPSAGPNTGSGQQASGGCEATGTGCLIKLARKEAPRAEYVGGRLEFDDRNHKKNVLYFEDPTVERCDSIKLRGTTDRGTEYLMIIARKDYYGSSGAQGCAEEFAFYPNIGGVHVG